jgi:hypothetical protein
MNSFRREFRLIPHRQTAEAPRTRGASAVLHRSRSRRVALPLSDLLGVVHAWHVLRLLAVWAADSRSVVPVRWAAREQAQETQRRLQSLTTHLSSPRFGRAASYEVSRPMLICRGRVRLPRFSGGTPHVGVSPLRRRCGEGAKRVPRNRRTPGRAGPTNPRRSYAAPCSRTPSTRRGGTFKPLGVGTCAAWYFCLPPSPGGPVQKPREILSPSFHLLNRPAPLRPAHPW